MNPNPFGDGLALNISETSNEQSLELALDVAESFRVDQKKSRQIVANIKEEASKWRALAKELRISSREQDGLADAFRVAE